MSHARGQSSSGPVGQAPLDEPTHIALMSRASPPSPAPQAIHTGTIGDRLRAVVPMIVLGPKAHAAVERGVVSVRWYR